MPTEGSRYAIGELAALAGTTPRTVRYYVAQGVLPAPVGAGPGAHYTEDHLARLRLTRRLQRQHQPLAEIRQRLGELGDLDIVDLLADDDPDAAPPNTALEYLRGLFAQPSPAAVSRPTPAPTVAQPAAPPLPPPMARATLGGAALFRRAAPLAHLAPHGPLAPLMPARAAEEAPGYATLTETSSAASAPAVAQAPATEQRSQWDRIALTPNIEIHVRRPLGRLENRRVERLITIARQVLREEQP